MKSLIITNKINGSLNPNLPNLLTAAKLLTGSCDVILVGYDLANLATKIAQYKVVNTVFTLDHSALENFLVENAALELANKANDYTHVLTAADSWGKNLLPRIAGILEIGQISEVVSIVSPTIFKRFIYAGNVLIEVEALEPIKLLTIRTTNFAAENQLHTIPAPIITLSYTTKVWDKIKFISSNKINTLDLSNAKAVISGGIALGSKEAFNKHIRTLANKLNAAVGATRAAVEAGYAPNDCQVGQTGKVVAPNLYIAIGISGAVQHIAGMKDAKTVIAINLDPTAPIFEYADYGLIGDLFTLVPQLIAKL